MRIRKGETFKKALDRTEREHKERRWANKPTPKREKGRMPTLEEYNDKWCYAIDSVCYDLEQRIGGHFSNLIYSIENLDYCGGAIKLTDFKELKFLRDFLPQLEEMKKQLWALRDRYEWKEDDDSGYDDYDTTVDNLATDRWGGAGPDCTTKRREAAFLS